MSRRVVITGMGLVCPLSCDVEETWKRLISGDSGIEKIISFEVDDISSRIAGQVPCASVVQKANNEFITTDWIPQKEVSRVDTFIVYAIAAATSAMRDSGLVLESEQEMERAGVLVGSGIGGLPAIFDTSVVLKENGPRRVSPFFIPSSLINLASGHISIKFSLMGPNHSVVTACASGTHAIGDAARIIRCGEADVMLAGGAEAAVCRLGVAGFSAVKALSTSFNDNPHAASRPWDRGRDGFVISEGAAVLILEELEHAKNRGAKIYGELVGYGMSSDAYHITSPAKNGDGAYRAMRNAINSAQINVDQVNYINAHGTSTPVGDLAELCAVERLFGKDTSVLMSSTKSSIGHALGAAGALEAVFTLLAMRDGLAPPTINLQDPEDTFIDLVANVAKECKIDVAISNSFGFGGTNASLVFKAYK